MTQTPAQECWVLTDGTVGMENQCLGIAERLPLPIRVFRLKVSQPWRAIAPYSFGAPGAHLEKNSDVPCPPWPRIAIGCGRQSIPFMKEIRRASRGATFTVQCQDPRVSIANFDFVIPPLHDGLTGPNVFPILGSPNRITSKRLADARDKFANRFSPLAEPRVAVLIGGSSHTHGSFGHEQAATLAHQLAGLARSCGLMISTSRRTPADVVARIRAAVADSGACFWDGTGPNPYLGMLAWADAFIVTADSVNMVCEAAATGKPIHLVAAGGGGRKARLFRDALHAVGITRPFTGKIEDWRYPPLDETGRVTARIRSLLDLSGLPTDMNP